MKSRYVWVILSLLVGLLIFAGITHAGLATDTTTAVQDDDTTNYQGQMIFNVSYGSEPGTCSAFSVAYAKFSAVGFSTAPTVTLAVTLTSPVILGEGLSLGVIRVYSITNAWAGNTMTWTNHPVPGAAGSSVVAEQPIPLSAGQIVPGRIQFKDPRLLDYVREQADWVSVAFQVEDCQAASGSGIAGFEFIAALDNPDRPLPVQLNTFTADGKDKAVEIRWDTASEVDVEGFDLYRQTDSGELVKINGVLIPATGNYSSGSSYEFADTEVINGVTYTYHLEAVSTSGERELLAVATATPRRAGKGR